YGDWVRAAHPPGVSTKPLAPSPASPGQEPVVREPRDGSRWRIDPARGATVVPLRALVGGLTVADVGWEVDGARLAGAAWAVTAGEHTVVAIWQGRRSRPARVRVEQEAGR